MAKVWKKLQRSDSAFTGDVTGTVDSTAAATIKAGAVKANLGLAANGDVSRAIPVGKGGTGLTSGTPDANYKNSNVVVGDISGTLPVGKGGTGLTDFSDANYKNSNVAVGDITGTLPVGKGGTGLTDFSDANYKNSNTTKTQVGLGSVLDQAQVTTFVQDGIPVSLAIGDIWLDSNDNHKMYRAASVGADAVTAGEWILTTLGKGALGLVKGDVNLGNVDNTSDALKPVSTAQGVAIGLKANTASPTFTGTVSGISKAMVGLTNVEDKSAAQLKTAMALDNVNNTTDALKPVSTAQGVAIGLKANIAGPTFTGTVAGISKGMVGLGSVVDQAITIVNGALKFGGVTQTLDEDTVGNSAKVGGSTLAETKAAAVATAEGNIIGSAPGALDTLGELGDALLDDPAYITSTIVNSIATKGKAPMALTAEDTDGDATYTNDPASEVVGQTGIYSGHTYIVVDI